MVSTTPTDFEFTKTPDGGAGSLQRFVMSPSRTAADRSRFFFKRGIIFQAADEGLEVRNNDEHFVIPLLVDVDHARFTDRTAFAVIEAHHIVSRGRAVSEIDTDRWITHFITPKLRAEPSAKRTRFLAPDRIDNRDGDMVLRPLSPLLGSVVCPPRNSAILELHELGV